MKRNIFHPANLAHMLLGAGLCATASAGEPVPLETNKADLLNRFSASYRMMFNVNVSFKNSGGFTAQTAPGPDTGGTENRVYDDGYNLVDNNNNSYGDLQATRNWGYDDASQVVDNRYIVMHSSSSTANVSSNGRDEDPHQSFEMTYQRELARTDNWSWGLEGAFGVTWISINDGHTLGGNVNRINDAFEVPADESGFRFIPPPGHRGSNLPGPLLGSEPTRTISVMPGAASITGRRKFAAELYGFRVGPYANIPLNESLTLNLGVGFAFAVIDSNFSFSETVTLPGVGSQSHAGLGSNSDVLIGGYVSAGFAIPLDEKKEWHLLIGGQFQHLGDYSHKEKDRKAVLDLEVAGFATIGLSHTF